MEHGESASARAALEHAAKATLALLSELSQREARRDASLDRQIESLRQEVVSSGVMSPPSSRARAPGSPATPGMRCRWRSSSTTAPSRPRRSG